MTLALYGKSRKRRGTLLLAALLAIVGSAVGAMLFVGSRSHTTLNYAATAQCDGDPTAHAFYDVMAAARPARATSAWLVLHGFKVNASSTPTGAGGRTPARTSHQEPDGTSGVVLASHVISGSLTGATISAARLHLDRRAECNRHRLLQPCQAAAGTLNTRCWRAGPGPSRSTSGRARARARRGVIRTRVFDARPITQHRARRLRVHSHQKGCERWRPGPDIHPRMSRTTTAPRATQVTSRSA